MKHLCTLAIALLSVTAAAQSNTVSVSPQGQGFVYNGPGTASFIDVDVTDPAGITVQALDVAVYDPAGVAGEIRIYAKQGSHIGSENNAGAWTQIGSAPLVSAGPAASQVVCIEPTSPGSTFLATGVHGFMVAYPDHRQGFRGVATYPSGPYTGPGVSIDNGQVQGAIFGGALAPFTFGGTTYPGAVPRYDFIYASGNVPHACALVETFGEGSNRNTASAFDFFGGANPWVQASNTLQGGVLSFIPNGSGTGYVIAQGSATFVPPSGGETNLPIADDQETPVTLTVPLQIPSDNGIVLSTAMFIHSNGYVSFEQSPGALPNSPNDPQTDMQVAALTYFCHHNFNNAEAGSGAISYEEDFVNGKTYVTWNQVESDPNTTVNPSTVQFQFDQSSGQVDIVFEQIDNIGASMIFANDNWLVGWAAPGATPRVDEFDFAALATTPLTVAMPEVFPFSLEVNGSPVLGQTFDLVSNTEPTPSIGINLIGTTQLPAPFDLSLLGAPQGAVTYLDPTTSFLNTISNLPGAGSMTLSFAIPNSSSVAGFEFVSQSFWLDLAASPAPFGNLVSSNAVRVVVGSF